MKILVHAAACVAIAFLGWQIWRQVVQYRAMERQLGTVNEKLRPVLQENEKLAADLKNLENTDTMLRELRRAGYAAPGEKVFVIVPKK